MLSSNILYIKYVFWVLGLLLLSLLLATVIGILTYGFSDNIHKCDVAIILGSKVKSNGLPSSRLKARLNKGIELYQQGMFQHIIVSGGKGKEGFDEATVMKKYLVAHHIPSEAVIADKHGNNTAATAANSRLIMSQKNFHSAIIISQYFHIARTRLAFKQCGISPLYHAHANYFEWRDFYSLSRETLAFYDYYFFNKCSK